jgi:carbon storage regulator
MPIESLTARLIVATGPAILANSLINRWHSEMPDLALVRTAQAALKPATEPRSGDEGLNPSQLHNITKPSRTKDRTMLVLSRKKDEKIIIGDNIAIMIVDIQGDKVRLGIEAPRDVTVHREEVYEAIQKKQTEPAAAHS